MSVLKRIEEAYLDVLRFIIIAAASLLLLGAIVAAGMAGNNWGKRTGAGDQTNVSVAPEEVADMVVAMKADAAPSAGKPVPDAAAQSKKVDPNQAFHERTATAVYNFVTKYGKGAETIDKSRVISVTSTKARQYKDPATEAEFAQGVALTMEKTLSDPKIIKLVELPAESVKPPQAPTEAVPGGDAADIQPVPSVALPFKESPIGIVNNVLDTYSRLFAERIEKKVSDRNQAELEESAHKATAMTQLYFAAGAFGAFLMLVFISIVVKIERNLRALTIPSKLESN